MNLEYTLIPYSIYTAISKSKYSQSDPGKSGNDVKNIQNILIFVFELSVSSS